MSWKPGKKKNKSRELLIYDIMLSEEELNKRRAKKTPFTIKSS